MLHDVGRRAVQRGSDQCCAIPVWCRVRVSPDSADSLTRLPYLTLTHTFLDMVTLDMAYFPHIFDSIFEFAEAEALLLLRLTCRRLRKRVDNEWRHLKWFVPWRKPVEVFNERGVKMFSDSPCLRLTKVLGISCEDGLADGPPFPDHLRPQIIRFLDVAFTPITSHAKR